MSLLSRCIYFKKQHFYDFYNFSTQRWHSDWNPSSGKTMIGIPYSFNKMAVDYLGTQRVKASVVTDLPNTTEKYSGCTETSVWQRYIVWVICVVLEIGFNIKALKRTGRQSFKWDPQLAIWLMGVLRHHFLINQNSIVWYSDLLAAYLLVYWWVSGKQNFIIGIWRVCCCWVFQHIKLYQWT